PWATRRRPRDRTGPRLRARPNPAALPSRQATRGTQARRQRDPRTAGRSRVDRDPRAPPTRAGHAVWGRASPPAQSVPRATLRRAAPLGLRRPRVRPAIRFAGPLLAGTSRLGCPGLIALAARMGWTAARNQCGRGVRHATHHRGLRPPPPGRTPP